MPLSDYQREITDAVRDVPNTCFIAGTWGRAESGRSFAVYDPATGDAIAEVADAGLAEAALAIDAAQTAMTSWSATAPRQRSEVLRKAFELMSTRAESLARLIVAENGKTLADARSEVAYAAEYFRWFAEEAVRNAGEILVAPSGANRIIVSHQPIGISLLVTPWNFPAAMLTRKIAPALAAGCSVVCKPAEETPLTALAIAALLDDAGVPSGVVNVLPTSEPAQLVGAILADQRVRKLSFTGSTDVGKLLLGAASAHVVSCSMELGGNAPFVIFDDADLDLAVAGAMVAKMRNGGEACTAANRFYAQRGIAEEFSTRLAGQMAALRVGPGLDEQNELGPLVNAPSQAKVDTLVADALAAGAHALVGGVLPEGQGWFYPATVLSNVAADAAILATEIFGPVAPVVPFTREDEVIALANDTPYGLVSYVYTGDLARGIRVAEALEYGMVGLNRGLVSDPAAPFGGMKQSGLGREGSHVGMGEYLETKYIATSW